MGRRAAVSKAGRRRGHEKQARGLPALAANSVAPADGVLQMAISRTTSPIRVGVLISKAAPPQVRRSRSIQGLVTRSGHSYLRAVCRIPRLRLTAKDRTITI